MSHFAKSMFFAAAGAMVATLLVILLAGVIVGFELTEPAGESVSMFGVMAAIAGAMLGLRLAGEGCACRRDR